MNAATQLFASASIVFGATDPALAQSGISAFEFTPAQSPEVFQAFAENDWLQVATAREVPSQDLWSIRSKNVTAHLVADELRINSYNGLSVKAA